jgi:hypothetical protein
MAETRPKRGERRIFAGFSVTWPFLPPLRRGVPATTRSLPLISGCTATSARPASRKSAATAAPAHGRSPRGGARRRQVPPAPRPRCRGRHRARRPRGSMRWRDRSGPRGQTRHIGGRDIGRVRHDQVEVAPRHPRTSPSAGTPPVSTPQPRGVAARDRQRGFGDVGADARVPRAAPPAGSGGCSPIRCRGRGRSRKVPTQRDLHQRFGIRARVEHGIGNLELMLPEGAAPMMRETGLRDARCDGVA